MVCRGEQRTHVRATDLGAALLEAVLDVFALIPLVVPQPPNEVVQRLLEPAPTVSQLQGRSCSAPARTHIVTRCYPTRGSLVGELAGRVRGALGSAVGVAGDSPVHGSSGAWLLARWSRCGRASELANWRRGSGGGSLDWDDEVRVYVVRRLSVLHHVR